MWIWLCGSLERYGEKVAALQNTKWHSDADYLIGREHMQYYHLAGQYQDLTNRGREERELQSCFWALPGKLWKACNSKLVTAILRVGVRGGTRFLHVFSCYPPTFATMQMRGKDREEISTKKNGTFPGDFMINARVGSRLEWDDQVGMRVWPTWDECVGELQTHGD